MQQSYATILDRAKAAVFDSIILIVVMYGLSELFSLFENTPNYLRAISFVFLFIVYEPLFIAVYGGTIGHSVMAITVRKDVDNLKKISFVAAVFRFALKLLFGWLSFLIAAGNEKRKTVHDYAVGSIVINSKLN